jgi:hypothetical protein
MEGTDGFTLGIPPSIERGTSRVVLCGVVRCPPGPELVVPALAVSGMADTEVSPPDGRMSMYAHDHLLGCLRIPTVCKVQSD